MLKVKEDALYPVLLHQFKVDNPAMRATAGRMCDNGFTLDAVLTALAEDASERFTIRGGASRAPRGFLPDYGIWFAKLATPSSVSTSRFVMLDLFARTSSNYWSATRQTTLGQLDFVQTFDLSNALFTSMLDSMPLAATLRERIARMQVYEFFTLPLVAHLTATIGPMALVERERFCPFIVKTASIADVNVFVPAML
ncbi:MAG: hypothetical protein IT355_13190 [Gemmatimonadaceae bacterium]|nr:hypothetical protein [Gemmatimonadaceae bacterium]